MDENNPAEEGEASSARSFVGTAEYVSPELLRSDPVSKEADMWALGCVIYQMLSGKSPFKAPTDYLIFQKIKNLEYVIPEEFTPEAKDIVQKLLTSDPEHRLGSQSTGGIQAIKDHPFFEGIDWENLFNSTAPPLKERLEEEAKKHPVVAPKFDLDGAEGDEDDDDEDAWFHNQHLGQKDPFRDRTAVLKGHVEPLSPNALPSAPVQHVVESEHKASSSDMNSTSNRSSFLNRNSVSQQEENMKTTMSQTSSAQSMSERSGPHPTW